MKYAFTLSYWLTAEDSDPDRLVEVLGVTGWSDARIGLGLPGRVVIEFNRRARTARLALKSALADVRRALADARFVEAAPDLVGLTEVADLVGVTRQNMRKLMLAHHGRFPVPVHEGSVSLWHLAEVLGWLEDEAGYELPRGLRETAGATMAVNVARVGRRR